MTTTTTTPAIEEFNGVPVAKLRGTIAKLADNPELAEFRFTARIDVRGVLGIDGDVRNGYQSIDVEIDIDGEGSAEELEALIQASCKRSAVFDMLANPTLVRVGRKA